MKVCDQETSDSEGCCSLTGQGRLPLSNVLSTETLLAELVLPDLLIKEQDEEAEEQVKGEAQRRVEELKEVKRPSDGELGSSKSVLFLMRHSSKSLICDSETTSSGP